MKVSIILVLFASLLAGCRARRQDAALKSGAVVGGVVQNWRTVPSQGEIDALLNPINDPSNPYADYRPEAPSANGKYDLPGQAILDAMKASTFGVKGSGCLKTSYAPTHWSDLQLHYFCTADIPRYCYTGAVAGTSAKLSRPQAFNLCMALPQSFVDQMTSASELLTRDHLEKFKAWIDQTKANEIFQYVMFAQTNAFDPTQEQAIINAYYNVTNPSDRDECMEKRPRRTEDPVDGPHCMPDKVMHIPLKGKGR